MVEMSKIKKEIDCLTRLNELTGQIPDILQFLLEEDIIKADKLKWINHQPDKAKELQVILRDAAVTKKVQMVTYDWSILPVENICINIVTDQNQKEFVYNG